MLTDNEEAHDVAQETFARLWAHRNLIRDPNAVTSWIYRTSTRLAVDRLRQKWRAEPLNDEPHDRRDSPEQDIVNRDTVRRIACVLSAQELEAYILITCDRMTQEEAARVLKISDRTLRRILQRTEQRLERWRRGVA